MTEIVRQQGRRASVCGKAASAVIAAFLAIAAVPVAAEVADAAKREQVLRSFDALPLRFDERAPDAEFVAHASGYAVRLAPAGLEINVDRSVKPPVRIHFLQAGKNCLYGEEALAGRTNYLIGKSPRAWKTDVRSFKKIRYAELYKGTDLLFYGNQRELEFDLIVRAGGDPRLIRFTVDRADLLHVTAGGDLVIRVADRELRFRKPRLYQPGGGSVEGSFRLHGKREVSFEVGSYDLSKPLVIDPVLTYARHFGGTGGDVANAVAVDSSGNAYVTGQTASTNFTVSSGALQTSSGGSTDAFVTKISADGNSILYSTYLGGSGNDIATSIAVDSTGEAFVAGTTTSSNFPTVSAWQSTLSGSTVGFVTKLNAAGNTIVYSTYFCGGSISMASLAIDGSGDALIGGSASGSITTVNPVRSYQGNTDGFVALLNSNGSGAYFSTYLGGGDLDNVNGVAFDSSGGILVTGTTYSPDFPTVSPIRAGGGGGPMRTTDGGASWTPSSTGFTKGYLQAVAFNPSDATKVFAASSSSDIYKSTDGGVHWTASYVASLDVRSIVWDPSNSQIVYLGSYIGGGGVRKSTDGGTSWSSVSTGLSSTSVQQLAIDPSNSSHLLAGTGSGLSVTTNGGTSWALATGTSGYITAVAFAPSSPSTIYAAKSYTIYRSTDGGTTFTSLSGPAYTVNNFAVNPTDATEVYAACGSGLYHSTNSGGTWTKVAAVGSNCGFVAYWQKGTPSIIAGTDTGLYESTDSGATWQLRNAATSYSVFASAPSATSTAIFGISQQDGFVTRLNSTGTSITFSTFFGGSSYDRPVEIMGGPSGTYAIAGVTQSTDFPTTTGAFQTALAGPQNDFVTWFTAGNAVSYSTLYGGNASDSVTGAAMDSTGRVWIAGTTKSTNLAMAGAFNSVGGANFFASFDGGASWEGVVVPGTKIVINPANSQEIFAYGTAKISHSTDGGGSWATLVGIPDNATSISVAPDQSVFAGGAFGVYRSSDHGTSWSNVLSTTPAGIPSYTKVEAITTWEPTPSNVFVLVATDTSIVRSTDGGASWASVSGSHAASFSVDPYLQNIVFATPSSGTQILRSTNGGAAWSGAGVVAGGLPPYRIAISYANDANIFLVSAGAGLYKSTDGGATFNSVTAPTLTSPTLAAVAVVPSMGAAPETVLVGADFSLFASTDGAGTFNVPGLVDQSVSQIEAPGPGIVWAGTGSLLSGYAALIDPSTSPALAASTYLPGTADQSLGRVAVIGSTSDIYLSSSTAGNDDGSQTLSATNWTPIAKAQSGSGTTPGSRLPSRAGLYRFAKAALVGYDLALESRSQVPDPGSIHFNEQCQIVYVLKHLGGATTDAKFYLSIANFKFGDSPTPSSGSCTATAQSSAYNCVIPGFKAGDTVTVSVSGSFTPPTGYSPTNAELAQITGLPYGRDDINGRNNFLLTTNMPSREPFVHGDANRDGTASELDMFYMISTVFGFGPAPQSLRLATESSIRASGNSHRVRTAATVTSSGDANGDGVIDQADVEYLFQYFFNGGPAPK